jgi:threonine/homoserine/homoserine lactone efflux protein
LDERYHQGEFVENLTGIFISSFIIAFSGAIVPGPVLSITITESLKRNFWAGPMIVMGHGILEILLIVFLVAGFADFMNNKKLLSVVGILGGLYLLWMSFSILKDLPNMKMEFEATPHTRGGPVWAGIMTSLANPYWILWWATIGLGYVIISMKHGYVGVVIFFTGHILADLMWYSVVSGLIVKGKRVLSVRVYRGMIAACAGMLILFGVTFSLWGIRNMVGLA